MRRLKIFNDEQKGYVLLGILFMMILIAVTAVALNRRASLQAKMAANETEAVQAHFGQLAAIEHAAWQLKQNPNWRTSTEGENYMYNGVTYKRKVLTSSVPGYSDTVTVRVTTTGGLKPVTASFRLNLVAQSFYFLADTDNHRIRMVDTATGIITTVAGTGFSGFSGDGGPATQASLHKPRGVAVDASGNIYIADTKNHCIRKVDASGTITTVAGIGKYQGYSGDGGEATSAELYEPRGVFVDPSGNIYIADSNNDCIRKVDESGTISTVAGIGGSGGYSGDGGEATSARLDGPQAAFVDSSGNIYIADADNHCIRKVDESGTITTVAGTGDTSGYSGNGGLATNATMRRPQGIFVDSSGNVYIADTENHIIRRVDAATRIITTVAGTPEQEGYSGDGGLATNARLSMPYRVQLDTSGNMIIGDTKNHRIRSVDATTRIIITVAGTGSIGDSGDGGPATSAMLNTPEGLFALDEVSSCSLEKLTEVY